MRFIDTNLFIRYFTRDDEEKAQKVLALLKRVEKDKERIQLEGCSKEDAGSLRSSYR